MKAREIMTSRPEGDRRLAGIVALADVAREVGPRDPAEVVKVLSGISEPAADRTPALTT